MTNDRWDQRLAETGVGSLDDGGGEGMLKGRDL